MYLGMHVSCHPHHARARERIAKLIMLPKVHQPTTPHVEVPDGSAM